MRGPLRRRPSFPLPLAGFEPNSAGTHPIPRYPGFLVKRVHRAPIKVASLTPHPGFPPCREDQALDALINLGWDLAGTEPLHRAARALGSLSGRNSSPGRISALGLVCGGQQGGFGEAPAGSHGAAVKEVAATGRSSSQASSTVGSRSYS